jgi:hypothetical protein
VYGRLFVENTLAPSHFRTKEMIAYFHSIKQSFGFTVQFNYFAECHGKSECDRHFGLISRIYTEYTCKSVNPEITTTDEFLTMYKDAIRRFGGNVIPSVGGNHEELLKESGKALNVVAMEFNYEGAEEYMVEPEVPRKDALAMPLPYTRTVFAEKDHFVFNMFYHFQFQSQNGEEVLAAKLHQHHRRSEDEQHQIKSQTWHTFKFAIKEIERNNYEVSLGVRTSVRRKHSSAD